MVKGYSQVECVDYTDTYVPVAWMESMWALLHISASLDWEIHQLDVKTTSSTAISKRRSTWNNRRDVKSEEKKTGCANLTRHFTD